MVLDFSAPGVVVVVAGVEGAMGEYPINLSDKGRDCIVDEAPPRANNGRAVIMMGVVKDDGFRVVTRHEDIPRVVGMQFTVCRQPYADLRTPNFCNLLK